MTSFHRRGQNVIARVGEFERALLQRLMASVVELLASPESSGQDPIAALVGWKESAELPSDPAIARLLPAGVEEDGPQAQEFRRLSEASIRQAKINALQAAAVSLDHEYLKLTMPQAELFAQALNDVRMVLAERLEIREATDAQEAHLRFQRTLAQAENNGEADGTSSQGVGDGHDFAPGGAGANVNDELLRLYYFVSVLHHAVVAALLGRDTPDDTEFGPGDDQSGTAS